jgi:hypothetical protein
VCKKFKKLASRVTTIYAVAIPMIWRELKDHITDCDFCLINVMGFPIKSKHSISNPNLASASQPLTHDENLPIPTPPATWMLCDDDDDDDDTSTENEPTTTAGAVTDGPDIWPSAPSTLHLIIQDELNNPVTDSYLSKMQAELLGSTLQG